MTANEIYLRSEAEKALREADYQRGRADRYQLENKTLKSELARWSRLAEFIELPDYPSTQFQPKDLERENTKLRELVADMRKAFIHNACFCWCDYMPERCDGTCQYLRRMRDLGIEVDE